MTKFTRFSNWLEQVPEEIRSDLLWRMEVYRLALFAADLAWLDLASLRRVQGTRDLSDQLYRAVCSISANIAEGFSRGSGKDRVRFYEYALGSARESRDWYFKCRHVLEPDVSAHRIGLHTSITKQLLSVIPGQRSIHLRESPAEYNTDMEEIAVAES
jgi:four helix bundle protein